MGDRPKDSVEKKINPREDPTAIDPTSLGMAGFAFSLLIISLHLVGVFPQGNQPFIAFSICFGGLMLAIAAIHEAKNGNTFGFSAFGMYSAFWFGLGFALLLSFMGIIVNGVPFHRGLGLMSLSVCIFTWYLTIASIRNMPKMIPITLGVLGVATMVGSFAFLTWNGVGNFLEYAPTNVFGALGIFDSFLAMYVSAATVINPTWGKEVLPMG